MPSTIEENTDNTPAPKVNDTNSLNKVHHPTPAQRNPLYQPPFPQQPRLDSSFRQLNPPSMNSGFQPMRNQINRNFSPAQRPARSLGPPPYMHQQNQMQMKQNAKGYHFN